MKGKWKLPYSKQITNANNCISFFSLGIAAMAIFSVIELTCGGFVSLSNYISRLSYELFSSAIFATGLVTSIATRIVYKNKQNKYINSKIKPTNDVSMCNSTESVSKKNLKRKSIPPFDRSFEDAIDETYTRKRVK